MTFACSPTKDDTHSLSMALNFQEKFVIKLPFQLREARTKALEIKFPMKNSPPGHNVCVRLRQVS